MSENQFYENNEENNEMIEEVGVSAEKPSLKKTIGREISEWICSIAIALVVALILTNFVVLMAKVDGESMLPTLHHNERLVVWRLGYKPESGDIIILNPPGEARGPYVKRVIATQGQTVRIDSMAGVVYVDDVKIDEPYINNPTTAPQHEYVVPEGNVFVMGDNRGNSNDSRRIGPIPVENVIGKVVFRLWPLNMIGIPK